MDTVGFMEGLLTIEAEAKHLFGARDRSYERTLMQELLKILKEAEFLFGARDRSYELSGPRITECANAKTCILPPLRMARIYLSRYSRNEPWIASLELAHEVVHVLSPLPFGLTILEEGLAECFAHRYVNRVYGLGLESTSDPKYDVVMRAASHLLTKNEFVIKQLRMRQPVISKIDERLLVEVAGIELHHARFLCTDFESYWRTTLSWSERAARGAQLFVNGFHAMLDQWKSA